jgi:hypothetical protein
MHALGDDLFAKVLVARRVDGVVADKLADYSNDLVAVHVFGELGLHRISYAQDASEMRFRLSIVSRFWT